MEHACHLSTRNFVEAINPTPVRKIKGKLFARHQANNDHDDSYFDNHNMEVCDEGANDEGEVDLEDSDDEDMDLKPQDVVGKVLALVTQVIPFLGCLFLV